jgi:hypothetical protein
MEKNAMHQEIATVLEVDFIKSLQSHSGVEMKI